MKKLILFCIITALILGNLNFINIAADQEESKTIYEEVTVSIELCLPKNRKNPKHIRLTYYLQQSHITQNRTKSIVYCSI